MGAHIRGRIVFKFNFWKTFQDKNLKLSKKKIVKSHTDKNPNATSVKILPQCGMYYFFVRSLTIQWHGFGDVALVFVLILKPDQHHRIHECPFL